jgi:iron uptake system component EfeO
VKFVRCLKFARTARVAPVVLSACAALLLGACTKNAPSGTADSQALIVKSSDKTCEVSQTSAPSGGLTFEVENTGSKVTEFYLLGSDGLRIVGEVENIGPGLTRKLVVSADEGSYFATCKPGMVGDGLKTAFTVTKGDATAATPEMAALLSTATNQYQLYVREQSAQLNEKTKVFAAAITSGNDDEARKLYAPTRVHWERIEPVAESFGDLDPQLDAREADLQPGDEWTGWHRLEKDLWPKKATSYSPLGETERNALAAKLVTDTETLNDRMQKLTFKPDQLGNGAKELLDEVATGKVTGEEEFWSGTDLWDFQANVDGARIAFEVLKPALEIKDKALSATLTAEFASLQMLLDAHKKGDGFKNYAELTAEEIKTLADGVNALGEPLSRLTAAVVL